LERSLGGISPHFGSFLVDMVTDSRADAEQGALIKRAESFGFGPVQDGVSALDWTCGDRSVAVAGGGGAGFQVFCGDELILTAGGGGGGGIEAQSSTGVFSFNYEGGGGGGAQWNISGSNITQDVGGGCGGNSTTHGCTPDADFEDASSLSATRQVTKRMRSCAANLSVVGGGGGGGIHSDNSTYSYGLWFEVLHKQQGHLSASRRAVGAVDASQALAASFGQSVVECSAAESNWLCTCEHVRQSAASDVSWLNTWGCRQYVGQVQPSSPPGPSPMSGPDSWSAATSGVLGALCFVGVVSIASVFFFKQRPSVWSGAKSSGQEAEPLLTTGSLNV
jgi:hypothetical protein